jgi:hypothetical protein
MQTPMLEGGGGAVLLINFKSSAIHGEKERCGLAGEVAVGNVDGDSVLLHGGCQIRSCMRADCWKNCQIHPPPPERS